MTILVGNGGLCGGYGVAWGLERERKSCALRCNRKCQRALIFFLCSFCVNFVSLSPPAFLGREYFVGYSICCCCRSIFRGRAEKPIDKKERANEAQ